MHGTCLTEGNVSGDIPTRAKEDARRRKTPKKAAAKQESAKGRHRRPEERTSDMKTGKRRRSGLI